MKVRVRISITGSGPAQSREATWVPGPLGPVSRELRELVAAFEVGEIVKGMVADMVGGMAERAWSSPASRAKRSPKAEPKS